jgi:hypothetical protein
MSDSQDEVDRPEIPVPTPEVKQKRQLSQKQLDNLSKAREKAKVVLAAKRERTQKLQRDEKKLKNLKLQERECKVAAEMRLLQSEHERQPEPETPKSSMKKPAAKRKKKPKVVYYSSSSSSSEDLTSDESSSEEEVRPRRHRRRPAKSEPVPSAPPHQPRPPSTQSENEDAMLEHQYQINMRKMKRDMIMRSVFPTG